MKTIVCFGDSNTFGFKLSNFKRYQASERWTGILKERLKLEYCIKEEGLNGRTIAIEDPFQDGLCGQTNHLGKQSKRDKVEELYTGTRKVRIYDSVVWVRMVDYFTVHQDGCIEFTFFEGSQLKLNR